MTRADDLGDNAALTPNNALGDVHATVEVLVEDLERWIPFVRHIGSYQNDAAVAEMQAYLPKPTLVTVDLKELKAIARSNFSSTVATQLDKYIERLENES